MAKCIERMVTQYPLRRPATDPASKDRADNSSPSSIDNELVGMYKREIGLVS